MSKREDLEQAIAAFESQRATLGNAVVDAMVAAAHKELAALKQAETPKPAMKGERKLVTVMFADISGFTALAETMDPETVRDLINSCFEWLVPVIEKYEGTVDKFIGDEIMALFGAPIAHENDPERALRTALEMMEALTAFNTERCTDLGLHIGINTGLVITGSIGTRGRQSYSVMGDAVNVASRLEDISERGDILIGQDTHRLTAPLFEFDELGPIQVKGRAEPVSVYRLLAVKAFLGNLRGIAGLESPLVGRQVEFQALQEAVEQLQSGEGGIVTIVGEAGLGKSRLVAEVRAHVRTPAQWVEGRCLSHGGSIAYLLWLDLLRGLLGVIPEDPLTTVREALRERVQGLCPDRFEDVYPYLGRLLSLPLEAEVEATVRDMEGEQLKAGTFHAVETLFEYTARQQPLVVVCEDLHWADPTSVELLEYLLALTERAPLLFLCVFRPKRGHHCQRIRETSVGFYHHRHTDLWLAPLSVTESAILMGNLLRVQDLPQELCDRILGHTEGNPFYVEEIIRSLIDSGAIVRDEVTSRWIATRDVANIAIPDTLHGVLVARIDQLQEESKRVLQLAAVIGRIFLYRILAEIAATIPVDDERELEGEITRKLADPTLWEHVLTLQHEEMIRERARIPELEYIFKHQLTREAAYNGLLKKDRRTFHRRVAEVLERLFPDRIEEHAGLLAYHWERAEEPKKAAEYLLRAGDQARLVYAHEEAIDYYQRALTFLKDSGTHPRAYERTARTLIKLGLTYHLAFEFRKARQAYEEGFALWQRAGEMDPAVPLPSAPHTLRILRRGDPTSLDPAMGASAFSGAITDQLFSGLVQYTPELGVLPDVARSWEVLDGGRAYLFHLRDDVNWSDGIPVTAKDFCYAWKRMLPPDSNVEVRVLDEHTLAVELKGPPAGHFLHVLAQSSFRPVPQHVVEAHGEAWTEVGNMVTNGPFRLEAWTQGESVVLVRNPDYYGRFRGNVQRVKVSFTERAATLEAYEADSLDVLHLSLTEIARARQRYAGEYVSGPSLATNFVGFDVSQPPFDDIQVRRAFVLATDQERLADVVLQGHVFPATGGLVPPGMPGHSPGIALPYDPEQARQLLAEAGYPDGQGFPIVTALVSQFSASMGEYLQAQWQENLGVTIPWNIVEWATFRDSLFQERHLFILGWGADYPDPETFLGEAYGIASVENKAYKRLVEKAGCAMNQEERIKLYRQADRILVEEVEIMPLVYGRHHLLVKSWVTKYPTSPTPTQMCFLKDVIIEPH